MKRGRKLLLDARLQKRICLLLSQANTIRTVCDSVGIATSTYFDWMQKFPEFSEATTRARARGIALLVSTIAKASKREWRAALALLQRIEPRDEPSALQPLATPIVNVTIKEDKQSNEAQRLEREFFAAHPDHPANGN